MRQGVGVGLKAVTDGAVSPKTGKKVMLVFFVGGVTFMEIAALRFLSRQANFPYTIIVATTKLVNGNTFIRSIMPDLQRNTLNQSPRVRPQGGRGGGGAIQLTYLSVGRCAALVRRLMEDFVPALLDTCVHPKVPRICYPALSVLFLPFLFLPFLSCLFPYGGGRPCTTLAGATHA